MDIFDNLLGALQIGGTLVLSPVLRRGYNRWGATDAEVTGSLPGDELVPEPMLGYTHAVTIQAPPERVWQWLVQLGQGRGGMYSYEGLENLVGCDIHNVDRILPELQTLQVGELIRLGPKGYPCFVVAAIEPPRALILVSADPLTGAPVAYADRKDKGYSIASWQFVLQPLEGKATRFLVRQRLAHSPDLTLVWRLTEPVGFVMERKFLRSIRRLAEQSR